MKNNIKKSIIACSMLFSSLYSNQDACCKPEHVLFVGANYTHANVKVCIHPNVDSIPNENPFFEGSMGGMQLMYQYRPLDFVYAGVGSFWRYGSRCCNNTERALLDVDVHERIGYTIASDCCNLLFTPYTGFGFRYLSQRSKKNDERLRLNYNEFYIPVGFISHYELSDCFTLGLQAVWMPQVFSTVAVNVAKGAHFDLKRTVKNIRVGVPLIWNVKWCQDINLMIMPFYEKWENGRTTAITFRGQELNIPKNSYDFWGVAFSLLFQF